MFVSSFIWLFRLICSSLNVLCSFQHSLKKIHCVSQILFHYLHVLHSLLTDTLKKLTQGGSIGASDTQTGGRWTGSNLKPNGLMQRHITPAVSPDANADWNLPFQFSEMQNQCKSSGLLFQIVDRGAVLLHQSQMTWETQTNPLLLTRGRKKIPFGLANWDRIKGQFKSIIVSCDCYC